MTRTSSYSLTQGISWGLTLLVVLLPLFFLPGLYRPYRLPKEALLALLTGLLSWLWLLNLRRPGDGGRPTFPLLAPLSLYLVFGGLSLWNAINIHAGIIGFLNLAVGITLFWIVVNHVERGSVPALLRWITIAGTVVSLVGIAQQWGVEIPALFQAAPPSSTFGNKNMAAQYILFVLPLAYYFLLSSSEPVEEWLYSSMAALITTYLIYTGTRAAWGGALVAVLVLWFCLRAKGFSPQELVSLSQRKWAFLVGTTAFVLAMNILPPYFVPGWNLAGSPSALTRLAAMTDLEQDPSAQTRVAIWANSLAIFKDHPLLGAGKGSFQFIYPLYNRRWIKDTSFSVEKKAAEAHNDYVQLLAEVGFLGTLALLWILVLLAVRWWRALKEKFDPMILPAGFALTAILLEAFWDFPMELSVAFSFFWIYAGLCWVLSQGDTLRPGGTLPRRPAFAIIAFLVLCATVASILTFLNVRAEFYYSRALAGNYRVQTIEERLNLTGKDLKLAVQTYPYDYRYHFWLAIAALRTGRGPEALQANLRALSLNPYDINTLHNLGVIYTAIGNIPKAIQAFETAIRVWPDHINARNKLGQLYEKIGDKKKAVEQFEKTLRINPGNDLARGRLAVLLDDK